MSILHHPDDIKVPDIQVWDNAAFDNEDSDGPTAINTFSWSKQDGYVNQSHESLQSDCSKENVCPLLLKTPASVKCSVPVKPLNPSGVIGNSQGKPLKAPAKTYGAQEKKTSEERNIDAEIEETEKEINRLSTKLKSLQAEKAELKSRTVQRCGRIVPKQNPKYSEGIKMIDGASVGSKISHRAGRKVETTPASRMQSRRKSCVSKLQDIDEKKVANRRGNSMSLSPTSRKTLSKVQGVKQPATTVVSKRSVKKGGLLELIHPKKLFMDVEKSVPATGEKPLRTGNGRIVASRYSQTKISDVATASRKRSLPENYRGRASLELSRSKGPESRVKKRWEIPSEITIYSRTNLFADEKGSSNCEELNFEEHDEEE